MSRPAASADSEDILSSLRRLLTERSAPYASTAPATEAPVSAAESPEPGAESPEVERLVLTEALRIHPPEADAGEAASDEAEEETTGRRLHLGGALSGAVVAGDNRDEATAQTGDNQDDGDELGAAGTEEDTVLAEQAQPVPDDVATADRTAADDCDEQAAGNDTSAETTEEAEQMTQAQAWAKAPEQDSREPEDILIAEAAEERILDEDTLREIVAQTVREELMGELGERITRNVKKLVRREIQRALAERAFD